MTKDGIIKQISNANKTLSDVGHQTMLIILNHVCVPKLIPRMQQDMTLTKSVSVQCKMSQYLYVIISIYPFEGVLDRYATAIDTFLKQCIGNANVEARQNGRKSFFVWQRLAPENAQAVFTSLDYQN